MEEAYRKSSFIKGIHQCSNPRCEQNFDHEPIIGICRPPPWDSGEDYCSIECRNQQCGAVKLLHQHMKTVNPKDKTTIHGVNINDDGKFEVQSMKI
jgi:hypothetical protein